MVLLVAMAHYYPTLGGLTDEGRALADHLAGLHRFVTMAEADEPRPRPWGTALRQSTRKPCGAGTPKTSQARRMDRTTR